MWPGSKERSFHWGTCLHSNISAKMPDGTLRGTFEPSPARPRFLTRLEYFGLGNAFLDTLESSWKTRRPDRMLRLQIAVILFLLASGGLLAGALKLSRTARLAVERRVDLIAGPLISVDEASLKSTAAR